MCNLVSGNWTAIFGLIGGMGALAQSAPGRRSLLGDMGGAGILDGLDQSTQSMFGCLCSDSVKALLASNFTQHQYPPPPGEVPSSAPAMVVWLEALESQVARTTPVAQSARGFRAPNTAAHSLHRQVGRLTSLEIMEIYYVHRTWSVLRRSDKYTESPSLSPPPPPPPPILSPPPPLSFSLSLFLPRPK